MSDTDEQRREALTAAIEAANPASPPTAPAEVGNPEGNDPGDDDETDEGPEVEANAGDGTGEGEQPTGGRRRRRAQARINELVTQRLAERQRADELERRLAAVEAGGRNPTQWADEPKKTLMDFDFDSVAYEAYLEKRTESAVTQRFQEQTQVQKRQQAEAAFGAKAQAFKQQTPDFDTVAIQTPLGPYYSPLMIETIIESDVGPELAYFLGQNLDKAEAILQLSPAQQARELGRIEARLEKQVESPATPANVTPHPRSVTRAPAIGATVTASSPANKSLGDMSVEDHIAAIRVNTK